MRKLLISYSLLLILSLLLNYSIAKRTSHKVLKAADEPEPDPCLSHLSCQTCAQGGSCVWCAEEQVCVSPPEDGSSPTCAGATNTCDCEPFRNCGSCLKVGYCGWCEDVGVCYSVGARPRDCLDFHEQVCTDRLNLSTEFAILIAIILITLAGFTIVGVVILLKVLKQRREAGPDDLTDSTLTPSNSISSSMDTLLRHNCRSFDDHDYDSEEGSDEDGLIHSKRNQKKKKTKPFKITGITQKLKSSAEKLFGTPK